MSRQNPISASTPFLYLLIVSASLALQMDTLKHAVLCFADQMRCLRCDMIALCKAGQIVCCKLPAAVQLKAVYYIDNGDHKNSDGCIVSPENVQPDKLWAVIINDFKHHTIIGCQLLQQ